MTVADIELETTYNSVCIPYHPPRNLTRREWYIITWVKKYMCRVHDGSPSKLLPTSVVLTDPVRKWRLLHVVVV